MLNPDLLCSLPLIIFSIVLAELAFTASISIKRPIIHMTNIVWIPSPLPPLFLSFTLALLPTLINDGNSKVVLEGTAFGLLFTAVPLLIISAWQTVNLFFYYWEEQMLALES